MSEDNILNVFLNATVFVRSNFQAGGKDQEVMGELGI